MAKSNSILGRVRAIRIGRAIPQRTLGAVGFTALMALCFAACHAKPPLAPLTARSAPTFRWPVREGWKHETIPFPLDFAPGLQFRGLEELRFAPGFFKPGASTFWSYAFAWSLENPPSFDAPTISAVLREYFAGLARTVGNDKFPMDPAWFRAELAAKADQDRTILAGRVCSYDAFVTGQPIVLNVEVRLRDCPAAGGHVITFLLSPKSPGDPVWDELKACESTLHCE